jgi:ProP effector
VKSPRDAQKTIEALAELYPQLFVAEGWRDHKPIKIGIAADLLDGDLLQSADKWVLGTYTTRRKYLQALVAGAPRYDLDGAVAGEVTVEQAEHAAKLLACIDALRAKKAQEVRQLRKNAVPRVWPVLAHNSRTGQRRGPSQKPKPTAPAEPRLSLAGLKAAAQARKAANLEAAR